MFQEEFLREFSGRLYLPESSFQLKNGRMSGDMVTEPLGMRTTRTSFQLILSSSLTSPTQRSLTLTNASEGGQRDGEKEGGGGGGEEGRRRRCRAGAEEGAG
eukprot:2888997-Pyramimonas_sp.AAC.1